MDNKDINEEINNPSNIHVDAQSGAYVNGQFSSNGQTEQANPVSGSYVNNGYINSQSGTYINGQFGPADANQANNANNTNNTSNNQVNGGYQPDNPANNSYYFYNQNAVLEAQRNVKKKTMEESVGKNVMGILASVLVFAGILLFATAASEYFSDTMKVIGIFSLSAILFIVGRVGMAKKRNGFFLSLAGCGIGAVFISMFLAYGYFKLIDMMVLYIGLAIWSVLLSFLGGKDSTIFRVVGQCGVLASLIYVTSELIKGDYEGSALLLSVVFIVFYVGISYFYLFMDRKASKGANALSLVIDGIGAIFLHVAVINVIEDITLLQKVGLTALVYIFSISLVAIFIKRLLGQESTDGYHTLWLFYVVGSAICTAICTSVIFDVNGVYGWLRGVMGLVYISGLLLAMSRRKRKDTEEIMAKSIIFVIAIVIGAELGIVTDLMGIGFFVVPFALLAFFKKRKLYFTFAVITGLLYTFSTVEYVAIFGMFGLLFIMVLTLIVLFCEELYSVVYKIGIITMIQLFIIHLGISLCVLSDLKVFDACMFVCMSSVIVWILMILAGFGTNWYKREEDSYTKVVLGVANSLACISLTFLMFYCSNDVKHAVGIITALISVSISIGMTVKKFGSKSTIAVLYNDLKFTLFMIVALATYSAEGYVVSSVCIFVAIAAIIIGFMYKHAGTRIYGLVLSIIGIAKLVLFDITFDSNMTRAIVVLICGVVTFVICFLYNVFDKRLREEAMAAEAEQNQYVYGTVQQPVNPGYTNMSMQQANANWPVQNVTPAYTAQTINGMQNVSGSYTNGPVQNITPAYNSSNAQSITPDFVTQPGQSVQGAFGVNQPVMNQSVYVNNPDFDVQNNASVNLDKGTVETVANEVENKVEKEIVAENQEVLDNGNIESANNADDTVNLEKENIVSENVTSQEVVSSETVKDNSENDNNV